MFDADGMPRYQMPERCADCAFRPGTSPRRTPLQAEKAHLCVETGLLFFCHEQAGDGSSQVVCKGFIDAFTAKNEKGDYERLPEWKREVYMTALDAIEKAEGGQEVDLLAMVRERLAGLGDE